MRRDLVKRVVVGALYALLGGWASFAVALAIWAFGFHVSEAVLGGKGQLGIVDGVEAALGTIFVSALIGIPLMSIVVLPIAAVLGFMVIRHDFRHRWSLLLIGAATGPLCWYAFGVVLGANPLSAFEDPSFYSLLPFFALAGMGGICLAKQAWFARTYSTDEYD